MFPKDHPYYAWIIGSHEDIQAAKLEDVRQFFKNYYCPNNASLVLVGDFDTAKTKAMIEKYFGTIPRGAPVPPITAATPPITEERRLSMTDKVALPRVYMAWITSPIFKPGDAEATVAADILGGGKASRLHRSLVYTKQIAQDVSVSQSSYQLGSGFQITATVKPGHTVGLAISSNIFRLVGANHILCLKKSTCAVTWAITIFWVTISLPSRR
jgi:zinc protease